MGREIELLPLLPWLLIHDSELEEYRKLPDWTPAQDYAELFPLLEGEWGATKTHRIGSIEGIQRLHQSQARSHERSQAKFRSTTSQL